VAELLLLGLGQVGLRSGMLLDNTTLNLQTDLNVSGLQLSGISSLLNTNGNTLNISSGLDIGGGPEFDFTNVTTDNESELSLVGDASITKQATLFLVILIPRDTL